MNSIENPLGIVHVIAGLWSHTGGPSESVPGLCKALAKMGHNVHLVTLNGPLSENVTSAKNNGVHLHLFEPGYKHTTWYSKNLAKGLPSIIQSTDVVHVHGLWLHPMWSGCRIAIQMKKPLIMTPRGSLEPYRLKKSRWKKKAIAPFFDNRYLKRAACLHATADAEALGMRSYGLKNPIAVIPNGVEIPNSIDMSIYDLVQRFPQTKGKTIISSISRINPTKGLIDLIDAIPVDHPQIDKWHLIIFGPDERNHLKAVRKRIIDKNLGKYVTYGGILNRSEKWAVLAQSNLFILPTKNENFGIAIAEALAAGVPVITTHGAPWKILQTTQSGWWIPATVTDLKSAISNAWSESTEQLIKRGVRGKSFVLKHYDWNQIAGSMSNVYEWVCTGGNAPQYINFFRNNKES